MEKIIKSIALFTLFLTLTNTLTVWAEEALPLSSETELSMPAEQQVPGTLESTGIYFEVKNSEYLNIILASSELIKASLESVPEMVTMRIESAAGAASTQITLGGFAPQTTYHKYEDDYHNHVAFTTDDNGSYTYTQDLSAPHLIFIQPRSSTKFIRDDATGGDCYSIGIWDSPTKTCTLTMDLNETIQIDSDGITLDGNGHTLTGNGTGIGIYLSYLSGRSGVTIKNFNISQFAHGIHLDYSTTNNTIKNNIISNNYYIGIGVAGNGNIIMSNTIESNTYNGIFLYGSNNIISSNTVSSNKTGLYITGWASDNIIR